MSYILICEIQQSHLWVGTFSFPFSSYFHYLVSVYFLVVKLQQILFLLSQRLKTMAMYLNHRKSFKIKWTPRNHISLGWGPGICSFKCSKGYSNRQLLYKGPLTALNDTLLPTKGPVEKKQNVLCIKRGVRITISKYYVRVDSSWKQKTVDGDILSECQLFLPSLARTQPTLFSWIPAGVEAPAQDICLPTLPSL